MSNGLFKTEGEPQLEVITRVAFSNGVHKDGQHCFEIRILTTSLAVASLPHVSTWAPVSEVDETAKTLSRMLKDDQEVWVMYRGSVKAAYQNGERLAVYDMREANPDLTDNEHATSKIRDSVTNAWI